jgi:hypothetical protein
VPAEQVADALKESEAFEVWPEHWDAVRLFQACDTQWTVLLGVVGGSYHQGLDMCKVEIVREWLGIPRSAELLWQLRVMTSEAKKYLNP